MAAPGQVASRAGAVSGEGFARLHRRGRVCGRHGTKGGIVALGEAMRHDCRGRRTRDGDDRRGTGQLDANASVSFAAVASRCSFTTFTSPSTAMKFVSPFQRGTT